MTAARYDFAPPEVAPARRYSRAWLVLLLGLRRPKQQPVPKPLPRFRQANYWGFKMKGAAPVTMSIRRIRASRRGSRPRVFLATVLLQIVLIIAVFYAALNMNAS